MFACLSLSPGCNNGSISADSGNGSGKPAELFSASSFDGNWIWQENGQPVFKVVIKDGSIDTLESTLQQGKSTKPAGTNCSICPIDGLVSISFFNMQPSGQDITTFRFNAADNKHFAGAGVLHGTRTVEFADTEDIFLLPPSTQVSGELIRTSQ